jgi:hypothetical protein
MWNGAEFNLEKVRIADPVFRFQAVQDADYASLDGDYPRAFELYQQVVFNDELDWWSVAKATQEANAISAAIQAIVTPTPLPEDETERSNLSAYAYYRMMLLHIVADNQVEAESAYDTLMDNFGEDQDGYAFAELATTFWIEYIGSNDIQQACSKAIKYAEENQVTTIEILGSSYHGWQSHNYKPEDICPFK